ncbi:MAG: tetratricopeptide repeat protein [Flavobacteriales bacterium]|nr:tetratricopeptide repeat protein [Flavobacteriales bacterium]
MQHTFSALFLPAFLLLACGGDPSPATTAEPQPPSTLAEVEARILADPASPVHFAERAMLYERMDSLVLAENDWKRSIALDSTNARWHIALGDLYFRKIKLPEAEQRFKTAIRLAPDSTEGRSKLGEVYLMQSKFKEAMALANEALKLDPLDARLYNLKGWIHRKAGDSALAISSYQTAVERDPQYYDAWISLGIMHAAKHDPLAMQYYNSALEIAAAQHEALYDKAMFAQDHGQDSIALACYSTIERSTQPPGGLLQHRLILLEHKQQPREARAEFHRAIRLLPDYVRAYYSRGVTYELENMLDSARWDYSIA